MTTTIEHRQESRRRLAALITTTTGIDSDAAERLIDAMASAPDVTLPAVHGGTLDSTTLADLFPGGIPDDLRTLPPDTVLRSWAPLSLPWRWAGNAPSTTTAAGT